MSFEKFKNYEGSFGLDEDREPSEKQIAFAKSIAEELGLKFKYTTYKDVSDFITKNKKEFYQSMNHRKKHGNADYLDLPDRW